MNRAEVIKLVASQLSEDSSAVVDFDDPATRSAWASLSGIVHAIAREAATRLGGLVDDLASDAAQDVLVSLCDHKRMKQLAESERPANLVFAAAVNRLRSAARSERARGARERRYVDDGGIADVPYVPDPENRFDHELHLRVGRAVAQLSPAEQRLIALFYPAAGVTPLSHRQIADQTGLTVAAVAQRHVRIVRRLRNLLRIGTAEDS